MGAGNEERLVRVGQGRCRQMIRANWSRALKTLIFNLTNDPRSKRDRIALRSMRHEAAIVWRDSQAVAVEYS